MCCAIITSTTTQQLIKEKLMTNLTNLTNTINEIATVLEMNAMSMYESINMHNLMNEHDQIGTEDEIRKHLIEIAFNSRMLESGKKRYSKVCEISDNYFKLEMAAQ